MNFFATFAASSAITRAEEATSRLLAGIETGEATGRAAQAYKSALRRQGVAILAHGGPEALEAALNRLSDVPGRGADRRAVLERMWAGLDETHTCVSRADLSHERRPQP